MKEWRLILDKDPLPGPLNMAVDEHFFRSLGDKPRTFLRFYRWETPTASLGYSQNAEKAVNLDSCRRRGISVVRRITGGKLVLHHREVTYSIASSDVEMFTSTLAQSYRRISNGLILGLEKMGLRARLAGPPPSTYGRGNVPCFSHPARDEVEIGGRKVIGSAQKRVGRRFLQHGSIPLHSDEDILKAISPPRGEGADISLISLSEALGRDVDFEWAVERLAAGLAEYFQVRLRPKVLAPEEVAAILELRTAKYESDDWTLRRNPGKSPEY
jgi:lipoate-protein ligase A